MNVSTLLAEQSRTDLQLELATTRAELARIEQQLSDLLPIEPVDDGAVIRFTKYHGGYKYAAIRVDRVISDGCPDDSWVVGCWYITQSGQRYGRQNPAPMAWSDLLTWIQEANWGSIEVLS